jgi:hypothetical protein
MISLSAVQKLLVLSALAWAVVPRWGGLAFGAVWLLLAFATASRTRKARALLEANLDKLGSVPPEGLELVRRFPLAYVWPASAEGWGTTWQLTALLALILSGVFGLWALITWTVWYLYLLIPLAVQLFVGGTVARRIKLADRIKDDLKDLRVTHQTTQTLLHLKTTVGQWPPEPSPDPQGAKS